MTMLRSRGSESMSSATESVGAEASTRPADLSLHETSEGWRLAISARALAWLSALGDDSSGESIPIAAGELSMELRPNLVPGTPFAITGVVISDLESGARPRP